MSNEKTEKKWTGKYFTEEELECKCDYRACESPEFSKPLLAMIDEIREEWGKPLIVTSASRCETHNADVGGKPNSKHLRGEAVDMVMDQNDLLPFLAICKEKGVREVGLGKGWIHLARTRGKYKCWFY